MVIYCATEGPDILWRFQANGREIYEPVSFFSSNNGDTLTLLQRGEHIAVFQDGNQPLRSHIEILYSPELSDTSISCESDDEMIMMLHLTYRLAGIYIPYLYYIIAMIIILRINDNQLSHNNMQILPQHQLL